MNIIKQQLEKIYHFLIILVLLLALNVAFKFMYDWGGISVIVRTYIFVLIFYCVFLFSQIKYEDYIEPYTRRYGRMGKYKLFFHVRLFPFIFAVILSSIFVLVSNINKPDWPYHYLFSLLDGRFSNTFFYALIFYFILRTNLRPGIGITLFIVLSILFWVIDDWIYTVVPYGTGIGIVKLSKYIIFIFVLVYDYSRSRWKAFKAAVISICTGLLLFYAVAGTHYISYRIAGKDSPYRSEAVRFLLKAGFGCQYDNLLEISKTYRRSTDIENLIYYAGEYGREIDFETARWELIIPVSSVKCREAIFGYLAGRGIMLDFTFLRGFAEKYSKTPGSDFSSSEKFKKYFSAYFAADRDAFFEMFREGNNTMKIWIIDCLAYSGAPDAAGFLIEILTGIDRNAATHAYEALKKITGTDPAGKMKREFYDLEVINELTRWRDELVRGGH